jgi:hypothetical protein
MISHSLQVGQMGKRNIFYFLVMIEKKLWDWNSQAEFLELFWLIRDQNPSPYITLVFSVWPCRHTSGTSLADYQRKVAIPRSYSNQCQGWLQHTLAGCLYMARSQLQNWVPGSGRKLCKSQSQLWKREMTLSLNPCWNNKVIPIP